MSEHTQIISEKTSSSAANNIVIQRSLAIGAVNDPLEHEADAVADKVMRMPEENLIHRKCTGCKEDEENIHRKPSVSFIQKMGNDSGMTASDSVTQKINSTKGGGSGMDSGTKSFMESRFGTDFSGVKIHTGDYAAQMSQELNAQAFTVGNDVYFNSGKYNPESNSGKQLLAHELTHTVQQGENQVRSKSIQRQTDAGFEALSGVNAGLTAGTLTRDAIDGQTFTVNCGFRDYTVAFTFRKAYKGIYPYRSSGTDVNGIYVKIEASYTDNQKCGRCTPMRLIQVARSVAMNSSGDIESAQPSGTARQQRSGWGNTSSASRGWRVDTIDTATNAYVTNLSYHANEGNETTPAIIWDSPGQWTSTRNEGAEFYTAAVCEDLAHHRKIVACINWGYYINSSGVIAFRPATPIAICNYSQQVRDASERWDTISGNTATGVSF